MKNTKILILVLLIVTFSISSCKKDQIEVTSNSKIEIPENLDNLDIQITNLFENTTPNSDGYFDIGTSSILTATNINNGKIIYMSIISTTKESYTNGELNDYELNAKETAIALALTYLPYGYGKSSDETFLSIKNVIYSLESVKSLESAIIDNVNKNGYLEINDISSQLQAVSRFFQNEFSFQKNKSVKKDKIPKNLNNTKNGEPYILNDRNNGVRLDIESSAYNENTYTWSLNCTAYNENGIYLGLGRGRIENNLAYWDQNDIKYYIPPMNVGKFMGTFTSWSDLKQFFQDGWEYATSGDFYYNEATWDKAKLENIEIEITQINNAIVVLSPEIDDRTMIINFIYQSIGIIDIIVDVDGFNDFVYILMTDADFLLLMRNEYNNGLTGFTRISSEICDKFKDFISDDAVNLLIPDADELIKYILLIKKIIETGENIAGMVISWITYDSFYFEVIAEYEGMPIVTSNTITNITQITATGGGNVTSDGGSIITQKGVCWSVNQNPTTEDNITISSGGTGSFTSSINGLSPNTTYYVRAYATNSNGTEYGNQVSFITEQINYYTTVTDYDGNTYGAVLIGNQIWMAENLKTTHYSDGTLITGIYDSGAEYIENYGLLYDWSASMNGESTSSTNPSGVQGVCPCGWHLPSMAEWNELLSIYNSSQLMEAGQEHWHWCPNDGTNESGFTALPAGLGYPTHIQEIGVTSIFRSTNSYTQFYKIERCATNNPDQWLETHGFSVRCVKD